MLSEPTASDDHGGKMSKRIDWQDSFGLVLVLLTATMLVIAILGDHGWGTQIAVAIQAAAVLLIYRAAGVTQRAFKVAGAVAILAVVTSLGGVVVPTRTTALMISGLALLVLLGMGPAVIARRLRDYTHVGAETVYAALCIYLIAGMFYSVLYRIVGYMDPAPFFTNPSAGSPMDSLYFSFTTLTTLGYGDLTPAQDVGRMLAITEALIGQVYLVTVVALIMSNLGRQRTPRSVKKESE